MDDKITIIEGPPPTFETVQDGWALGLNEGPYLFDLAVTRLRAFNGPALVERCYRTWKKQGSMVLEYRNEMGFDEQATILAARNVETDSGHVLVLWIRRDPEEIEAEIDLNDEDDDSLDLDLP
jgi:hypothetical protein